MFFMLHYPSLQFHLHGPRCLERFSRAQFDILWRPSTSVRCIAVFLLSIISNRFKQITCWVLKAYKHQDIWNIILIIIIIIIIIMICSTDRMCAAHNCIQLGSWGIICWKGKVNLVSLHRDGGDDDGDGDCNGHGDVDGEIDGDDGETSMVIARSILKNFL